MDMKYIINYTKIIHADSPEEARKIYKIFYETPIYTITVASKTQQTTFW